MAEALVPTNAGFWPVVNVNVNFESSAVLSIYVAHTLRCTIVFVVAEIGVISLMCFS